MLLIFSQDATFISSTFGRFAWLIICVQYLANISGWDLAAEVNSQKSWSLANVDRVLLAGLPRTSSYNIWYKIYNIQGFPCSSSYNIQNTTYIITDDSSENISSNYHIIKFQGGIRGFRSCHKYIDRFKFNTIYRPTGNHMTIQYMNR